MATMSTTPAGINAQPRTPAETMKNWQRLAQFLAAGSMKLNANGSLTLNVAAPITDNGTAIILALAAASGLTVIAGQLSLLLDPSTPCLQLTRGLKVTVNAAGALTQTGTGLQVNVDGTTIAVSANALQVKAGGIGATQLGVLTTKGDLLGFSTLHVRVAVGTDGQVLTADSTQAAGFKWATVPAPPTPGATTMTASENIAAGALINVWSSTGAKCRNADNSTSAKRAHGFAPNAIAINTAGTVIIGDGTISGLAGLVIGTQYFLGATGAVTTAAPTATGSIIQSVGVAFSTAVLLFNPGAVGVRS